MTEPAAPRQRPDDTRAHHHHQALHRAVTEIHRAWPHANLDADTRGYPAGRGNGPSSIGDHSDPTPNAALHASHAVAWLAELADIAIALHVHRPEQQTSLPAWRQAVEQIPFPGTQPQRTLRDRIYRLADQGASWWPAPPATGTTIAGVTIGARSNTVEVCALCGEPTLTGRNEAGQLLTRRIDGDPYHATAVTQQGACWWQVWRQRRRGA